MYITVLLCHVFVLVSVEVLTQGTWNNLGELEDPELVGLAQRLQETIACSRVDSTVKKYLGAFRRSKVWASQHDMPSLPARESQIALYLQSLGERSQSKSAVEEACNAIAWAHSTAGLPTPTTSPFVKATLEGMQRLLARPVVKKAPITPAMLEDMVEDAKKNRSLADLRLTTACLLSYAGFLWFNELVNTRLCDITIDKEKMVLYIPHSKTDQLRKGDELVIARTQNRTCPVAMLESYLLETGTLLSDQRRLFRPICKSKKSEKLRKSGSISYSCLRDLFKKKLKDLGYNSDEFGLHSLRAGGATAAANSGVPDRLFKRHGRWKSDGAKDGYIEDTAEHRLEVTKNIGL